MLKNTIKHIKKLFYFLFTQEGTPGKRARGIAAGIFCGCYPLFGLQVFCSVFVASLIKGNKLLAAAATLISNPFTYIPLYWFNYQVGVWVLDNKNSSYKSIDLNLNNVWSNGVEIIFRLLLGSTIVGVISAIAIGYLMHYIFYQQILKENRENAINTSD